MPLTLKDSRSYETQVIDAVRSVNKALGGTYGGSSAIHKSDFNQYEVQLIDAIKGIARTLSGSGLSVYGGAGGSFVTQDEFQALVRRVQKLEDESFFRLVDGNVTLKDGYNNLWVPGFLAAGGLGSEGSGGVSKLRELDDVYHSTTSVLRADGSAVVAGDALVYTSEHGWVAGVVSGSGSTVVVSNRSTSGSKIVTLTIDGTAYNLYNKVRWASAGQTANTYELEVNGTTKTVCLDGYGGGGGGSTVSVTQVVSSGTKIATITVDSVGTDIYAPPASGYVLGTALASAASQGTMLGVSAISYDLSSSGSEQSLVKWEPNAGGTGIGAWHFYGNVYADGWMAAGGIGSAGGSSSTLAGLTDVSISSPSNGQALVYRNGIWNNEALPSGTAVSWTGSGSGYTKLTVSGDERTLLTAHQSIFALTLSAGTFSAGTYTPNSSAGSFNIPTTLDHISDGTNRKLSDYVTLATAQTITGAKTFATNNVTLSGVSLLPSANDTCGIGSSSYRFADIYGVDEDLSGDLTLSRNSTFKIGPVTITYDGNNHALHISGTDNGATIGVYCDGFMSAGGTA